MCENNLPREAILRFKNRPRPGVCAVFRCCNAKLPDRVVCNTHKQKLWRTRNPTRAAFRQIKDRAARKGLEFSLSFEDFEEFVKGTGYMVQKGVKPGCLHVDRIDNRVGYVLGNLQILTASENCRKGAYEGLRCCEDDFIPTENEPF